MDSAAFSVAARNHIQSAKAHQLIAEEDEANGLSAKAAENYILAADYYLQAAKAEEKNQNAKAVLRKYADWVLGKAEVLKGRPCQSTTSNQSIRKPAGPVSSVRPMPAAQGDQYQAATPQVPLDVSQIKKSPSQTTLSPADQKDPSPLAAAQGLPLKVVAADSPKQNPAQVTNPVQAPPAGDQNLDDQPDVGNPAYKSNPPEYKSIVPPAQPDTGLTGLENIASSLNLEDGLLDVDFAELKANFGQLLGEGSFGSVFKCKWQGLPVAVKVIKFGMTLPEEELRVFMLEVELLKSLRHPNIVQFLGASLNPPNLAIVTELLSGNLWDLIHNRKYRADLSSALHMARDVARGLAFLHSKKVIHRDIKSGNVLIDGPGGRLKLVDFGLARTKAAASKAVMTRAGTRFWMAPEIMLGKPYDEAVDIYSFAVLLYEIASCQIPYYGMDEFAVIQEVAYKGYRLPIPANVHPILRKLIQASWNQDPDARPKAVRIIDYIDKKLGDV